MRLWNFSPLDAFFWIFLQFTKISWTFALFMLSFSHTNFEITLQIENLSRHSRKLNQFSIARLIHHFPVRVIGVFDPKCSFPAIICIFNHFLIRFSVFIRLDLQCVVHFLAHHSFVSSRQIKMPFSRDLYSNHVKQPKIWHFQHNCSSLNFILIQTFKLSITFVNFRYRYNETWNLEDITT